MSKVKYKLVHGKLTRPIMNHITITPIISSLLNVMLFFLSWFNFVVIQWATLSKKVGGINWKKQSTRSGISGKKSGLAYPHFWCLSELSIVIGPVYSIFVYVPWTPFSYCIFTFRFKSSMTGSSSLLLSSLSDSSDSKELLLESHTVA